MGLIKTVIGSALGGDQPNNGFNRPTLPFTKQRPRSRYQTPSYGDDRPRHYSQYDRQEHSFTDDRQLQYSQYDHKDQSQHFSEEKARSAKGYASSQYRQSLLSSNPYSSSGLYNNTEYGPSDFQSHQDSYDPPPSYDTSSSRGLRYQRQPARHYQSQRRDNGADFRPVALPQVKYGDGQPFFRGYSSELARYGITEGEFIRVIDRVNVAVVPNPENQIFQKAANIAGWFVPGAAGIGLMAGQLGVGVTAAFGHMSLVARSLSEANLEVFLPKGLEICICGTKDIDKELRISSNMSGISDGDTPPESRLASYGDLIAYVDSIHAPAQHTGRKDPLAKLGNALSSMDTDKKVRKAQGARRGKSKGMVDLESSVKWLMVRRATPAALEHWRKTLDQSNAALRQEEEQAGRR